MKGFVKMIFCLAMATLSACNQRDKATTKAGQDQVSPDIINNPATASGTDADKKLPVFSFVETTHYFGTIHTGERMSCEFKFKNTGNAALIISQANGSCDCNVPEYPKDPIKPGEEGAIKVKYNSDGHSGMVSKTVTILSNAIPNTKVLTISAEVLK